MKLKTGDRFKDFLEIIYTIREVSASTDTILLFYVTDGKSIYSKRSLDEMLFNINAGLYTQISSLTEVPNNESLPELIPLRINELNDYFREYDREADLNRPTQTCNHTWKAYVGLNETFDYCSKCDEKK